MQDSSASSRRQGHLTQEMVFPNAQTARLHHGHCRRGPVEASPTLGHAQPWPCQFGSACGAASTHLVCKAAATMSSTPSLAGQSGPKDLGEKGLLPSANSPSMAASLAVLQVRSKTPLPFHPSATNIWGLLGSWQAPDQHLCARPVQLCPGHTIRLWHFSRAAASFFPWGQLGRETGLVGERELQ